MGNFDVDKAMQTLVEHGFIDKDGHPINIPSVTPQEPSNDMVSRGVFEQVVWERDVAIEQLKELGYGLGEKPKTGHWISCSEKPNICENAISRTRAMETFAHWAEHKDYTHVERHILHAVVDELRAMPSINEQDEDDEWAPILKDLYDGMAEGGKHERME